MNITAHDLEGQQVRLIPLLREHTEQLFDAGNYEEIWTYMPAAVRTLSQMSEIVETALKARDNGTEIPYVIYDKKLALIVGTTRLLDISHVNRSMEIGWTWLSPRVWRTVINTECKYLLLQYCFETAGAIRVQLKTDSRNVRSQTAIERIGGVREGVLRNHRILHNGYVRDSVYYSILADEWPAAKDRLSNFMEEHSKIPLLNCNDVVESVL